MRWLCLSALIAATSVLAQAPRTEPDVPSVPAAPADGIELRPPGAPDASLPATLFVREFRVVGAALFETEIATLLAPYTGRTLTAGELARASAAVTGHLRDKGLLVAQAFIPPQQIRDGVVEMRVFEGRIGAVRLDVADDSRVRRSVAEGFVRELRPGETVRRDNVEQSLLLLNDLPGVRVDASLAPAAQPGSADLDARVRNDGGAVAGRLTLDNAGLYATGEYRGILDLRVPSPLGIGDLLAGRLLQSTDGGQTLGSLTYGAPVNASGTRFGGRYTAQRYELGKDFAPLRGHGDSRAWSLLGSHALLRRSDHNVTGALSYTDVQYDDRLDAVGFVSESRHRIAAIGIAADERDSFLGRGASALQLQYLYGRVYLDTPAIAEADAGPGGLGVAGAFSVLRLRAQRAQAVTAASRVQLSINGQLASKNLDAGNELAVGGPDAVRAYPVGELYADQGFVGRAEYVYDIGFFDSLRSAVTLFFDDAHVRVNRNPLPGDSNNGRHLSGYGFGVSFWYGRDLSLQTWLAWRATSDEATAAPDRSPRAWATLSLQF